MKRQTQVASGWVSEKDGEFFACIDQGKPEEILRAGPFGTLAEARAALSSGLDDLQEEIRRVLGRESERVRIMPQDLN